MTRSYGDPFRILGLPPDATEKEIRKAYRRMAKQYHPDRNQDDPEAAEKFKQVQWAYETLIGKKKEVFIREKQGQYSRPFSANEHPFVGFFWFMRDYRNKKKGSQRND